MQNGAPVHKLLAVKQRFAQICGNCAVALYHDLEWPPRSPDLTSCGFFGLFEIMSIC